MFTSQLYFGVYFFPEKVHHPWWSGVACCQLGLDAVFGDLRVLGDYLSLYLSPRPRKFVNMQISLCFLQQWLHPCWSGVECLQEDCLLLYNSWLLLFRQLLLLLHTTFPTILTSQFITLFLVPCRRSFARVYNSKSSQLGWEDWGGCLRRLTRICY